MEGCHIRSHDRYVYDVLGIGLAEIITGYGHKSGQVSRSTVQRTATKTLDLALARHTYLLCCLRDVTVATLPRHVQILHNINVSKISEVSQNACFAIINLSRILIVMQYYPDFANSL